MACKQRRGDKEDTESKDAEQPKAVEQEKETRSRRKRVRITNKEDIAIVQKPTTETPDDVKTYEMNTHEKDSLRLTPTIHYRELTRTSRTRPT